MTIAITNCPLLGMDHLRFDGLRNALQFLYLATDGWEWAPQNQECWLEEDAPISTWAGCVYRDTPGDAPPTGFEFLDAPSDHRFSKGRKPIWKPMWPEVSNRLVADFVQGLTTSKQTYKNKRDVFTFDYDFTTMTQTRDLGSDVKGPPVKKGVRKIRPVGNGWEEQCPVKRAAGLGELVVRDDWAFRGALPARIFEPIGNNLRVVVFSSNRIPTKLRNGAVARPGMRVIAVTDLKRLKGKRQIKAGDTGAIINISLMTLWTMDVSYIQYCLPPTYKPSRHPCSALSLIPV